MSVTEDSTNGRIETNGINIIAEGERHGKPRSLFWPWTAASISVLSIPIGAWALGVGGGLGFWQLVIVAIIGVVGSGLLCGIIAIAGKRGGTPTLVASRAAFGVKGNLVPGLISWLVSVGWEVLLVTIATLATATVFKQLGFGHGKVVSIVAFIFVIVLVVGAGVLGFKTIMKLQTWLTIIMAILTVVYFVLVGGRIHPGVVSNMPTGSLAACIGAAVLIFTSTGLGWANAAADYSRYLPRSASSRSVVAWTTIGLSVAPLVLIVFGAALVGSSDQKFSDALGADPIGTLATLLPTWFLVPFAVVAVLGLVAGAVLDIYSSGLTLLSLGIKIPRPAAAAFDGLIMVVGTIYIVFFFGEFQGIFQGFIITLGVPLAAWAGIMMADVIMRRKGYDEHALFTGAGLYKHVRVWPLIIMTVTSAIGFGLVTNSAVSWLNWQGYLLHPLGLGGREGVWAYANIGVGVAFVLAAVLYVLICRRSVVGQDTVVASQPVPETGKLPDFLKARADQLEAKREFERN